MGCCTSMKQKHISDNFMKPIKIEERDPNSLPEDVGKEITNKIENNKNEENNQQLCFLSQVKLSPILLEKNITIKKEKTISKNPFIPLQNLLSKENSIFQSQNDHNNNIETNNIRKNIIIKNGKGDAQCEAHFNGEPLISEEDANYCILYSEKHKENMENKSRTMHHLSFHSKAEVEKRNRRIRFS